MKTVAYAFIGPIMFSGANILHLIRPTSNFYLSAVVPMLFFASLDSPVLFNELICRLSLKKNPNY